MNSSSRKFSQVANWILSFQAHSRSEAELKGVDGLIHNFARLDKKEKERKWKLLQRTLFPLLHFKVERKFFSHFQSFLVGVVIEAC